MNQECTNANVSDRRESPLGWRRVAATVTLVLMATLVEACGSSSPSSAPTSNKPFVQQSGTGDKVISSVVLPSKWTVTWQFTCENPATARPFALTATKQATSPITVTDQTGLGGGGHKPYTTSGTYSFGVTTTCNWKLTVGPTPSSTATSTSTTSAQAGSTTSST